MIDIKQLYQKFLDKKCSSEEVEYLLEYFREQPNSDEISNLIQQQLELQTVSSVSESDDQAINRNRRKLQKKIMDGVHVRRVSFTRIWSSVAVAILILFGTALFFTKDLISSDDDPISSVGENILPGGNRAYISLSSGQKLELDTLQQGLVTTDGKLQYTDGSELFSSFDTEFFTLHTPIGGQYHIVLPDGTKVWLNSDSKLNYPIKFSAEKRLVNLEGEAYFEVAKDLIRPFIVSTKGQKVEVLGTRFNIKGYNDEPYIKTTLLEGAVKVYSDKLVRILKPGDQSVFTGREFFINDVDIEHVVDWKNGDFIFQQESLAHIMKRVSRWYGIEVGFIEGVDISQTFSGQVSRSKNLSEVITCLESTGDLQFKQQNNKIIIKPKSN